MIVVELALQGIKGFPDLVRLALKPGLNVAHPSDRALGTAIFDAFYHTLFPDLSRPNATGHLVMSRAERSRLAVTFFGRDRVTYRMIREADSGATKLYTYTAETKQYHLFSDVAHDAARYVRVQQHLPDEVTYERMFVFSPETMPSRKERARTRSGAPLMSGAAAPSAPGMPSMQHHLSGVMARPQSTVGSAPPRGMSQSSLPGAFGSSLNVTNALVQSELANAGSSETAAEEISKDDLREELARLRLELTALNRADLAQQELDQLNMRRFELTERVERVTRLEGEIARLSRQAGEDSDLENLPFGFTDRLKHFEELGAKYADDHNKVTDEIHALEDQSQRNKVVSLVGDKFFVGSAVGAFAFVVLAVLVEQPLIALFNIACALVMAGAAFRYVSDLEGEARAEVRLGVAREHLARLEKQHNLDTGATRRLMAKLEIDSPNELLARVEGFEKLNHQKQIAEETLESLMREPETASAKHELGVIQRRVEELETEVMSVGGSVSSAETVQRRIRSLEDTLGESRPRAPNRTGSIVGTPIPGEPPPRSSSVVGTPIPQEPRTRTGSIVGTPVPGAPRPRPGSIPGQPIRNAPRTRTGSIVGKPIPVAPPSRPQPPARIATTDLPPSARLPNFPGGSAASFTPDIHPERRTPISRSFSTFVTPIDPRELSQTQEQQPEDPLSRPPSVVTNAYPTPPAPTNPIPKADTGSRSLFDFGGKNLVDDDDDEEGYGSGYGGGSGGSDSGGSSASGSGYFAVGYGNPPSGFGGGVGAYGDGGGYLEPDRSRDLMQAAIDMLQLEVDTLGETIKPRLGQYLAAFTDRRFDAAEFGPRGELTVVPADRGDTIAYPALEPEDMDLVDSALRFCLVEVIVRQYRIPVLFDDPFTAFAPKKRKLLNQMLAYLGGATQVIVMSGSDDITGHLLSW